MLHLVQCTGLVQELLLQLAIQRNLRLRAHSHLPRLFVTVAEIADEEFLQCHTLIQNRMISLVGAAETA